MEKLLTVVPIGDELGIVLPEEVLATLGVGPGDELMLEETDDGFLLRADKN